jgi:alkylated DNA nucleotide flippase Atl1
MADNIVDLTAKAYEITRMIPHGHVTSYGGFTGSYRVAPGPAWV